MTSRLLLLVALAGAILAPRSALARPCAGIELSEAVLVEGAVLRLNGLAVRRVSALRVKVVLAGLYLENRTTSADLAMSSRQTKRLDLHLLRHVAPEDVTRVIRRGIRVNAPQLLPRVEHELSTLAAVLPEGDRGTLLSFVGLPSGESQVLIDGTRVVTFHNAALFPAILSIFLGPERGNDGVRDALLGTMPCQ